ncbi:alpha/beta fold hydrolase [Streptomyces sp. NPDC003514]
MLTLRVASLRPDLVRTWAGGNGPVDAGYVWHPLARIWQDRVQGDRYMAELRAEPFAEEVASGFDVPLDLARDMASRVDEPMKDAVLRLYRSALTMGAEWEPGLSAVSAPSVVFWGRQDPACQVEFGRKLGASLRSGEVIEMDCNHWTVLQRPAEVAEILEKHWGARDAA